MIDLAKEDLIAFSEVPKCLPRRPNGKTIHISAVYRWAFGKGIRGIVLESVRIGGTTYTSREALQRFADAITGRRTETSSPISRMTRTRHAQAQQAAREVRQRLGIRNPNPKPSAYGCTPDCTLGAGEKQPQVQTQAEVGESTVSKQANRKQPQQPVCPAITE